MAKAPSVEALGNNNPRHRFIKSYLALQGVAFADIAQEVGMSRAMVGLVSRGDRRNKCIEEAFIKYGIPRSLIEAI